MERIAVLVNPNAGRLRRRRNLEQFVRRRYGPGARIFLTRDLAALDQTLPEIRASDPEVLIIHGGDGSVRHFFERWFGQFGEEVTPPPVAPIPAGSQNYMAREGGMYIPLWKPLTLRRRRRRLAGERYERQWFYFTERGLLRVKDPSVDRTQYAFVYTDGVFFRVGKQYYEMGGNVAAVVRAIWGTMANVVFGKGRGVLDPMDSESVLGEGAERITGHIGQILSTVDNLVLSLHVFPDDNPVGRGFHAFTLGPEQPRRSIVRFMRVALWGAPKVGWKGVPGVSTCVTNEASIRNSEGYALEGEIYDPPGGRTDVKITLGPKVRLVGMRH